MTTTTVKTNTAVVLDVNESGVTVAVNGRNTRISWDDLHEAADQAVKAPFRGLDVDEITHELANFYTNLREQALRKVSGNRSLPIYCDVHQDYTNVWWVASFSDVSGTDSWIPRDADEGGTHAHYSMAKREADYRATRLRNLGFTVIER
jgi:hypothetical protein